MSDQIKLGNTVYMAGNKSTFIVYDISKNNVRDWYGAWWPKSDVVLVYADDRRNTQRFV